MTMLKMLGELFDDMHEELHGAKHYAKLGLKYKDTNKGYADSYMSMAAQELSHADTLYQHAHKLVKEYSGEEKKAVDFLWEREQERYHENKNDIKSRISLY